MSTTRMADPGPIALRAASEAEDNVGVRETPGRNNYGKFVAVYLAAVGLLQGNPWCMALLSAGKPACRLVSPHVKTGRTQGFVERPSAL